MKYFLVSTFIYLWLAINVNKETHQLCTWAVVFRLSGISFEFKCGAAVWVLGAYKKVLPVCFWGNLSDNKYKNIIFKSEHKPNTKARLFKNMGHFTQLAKANMATEIEHRISPWS